ncbi:MAG TPA: hypothetical protein VLH40_03170, partial [Atribacteraceae bacterium]|nr:hypothetical protein [Atribacteraceae bacterium]
MNKSRSEHLAFLLQKAGYREAPPGERADLLLFNTCAVRDHAVHKAISVINGYIAGYRGGDLPVVVVFGCLAELIREELVRRVPAVRVVAGTRNIDDIPRLIRESEGRRAPVLSFNAAATDPFREPGYRRKPGLSTFLPVTYGCDNFCSYCVVPYTTGRQTSKSLNLIRQ